MRRLVIGESELNFPAGFAPLRGGRGRSGRLPESIEHTRILAGLPVARISDRRWRAKAFSEPADLNYDSCFKQNPNEPHRWFSYNGRSDGPDG